MNYTNYNQVKIILILLINIFNNCKGISSGNGFSKQALQNGPTLEKNKDSNIHVSGIQGIEVSHVSLF